ncbi:MAG TPA: hypothetical protein ENG72_00360 [Thermococcus sp.]|nr:hypothetical protein [Thermococcus sp.]
MFIIDQHAAERINYEKMLKQHRESRHFSSQLC